MKKVLLILVLGSSMVGFSQLYEQTSVDGSGIISNYFTDLDTAIYCADDFTVPAGEVWNVDSLTFYGFRNNIGSNQMDSIKVEILSDNSGLPGTAVFSKTFNIAVPSVTDTALVLTFPAVELVGGIYWVSSMGYTDTVSRWNWKTISGAHGATAVLIDPSNFFGVGATNWTPFSSLGLTATDLAFSVGGVKGFVGIEENITSQISAFPNPVASVFTINLGDTEANFINILDMSGRIIKIINVNSSIEAIDVSSFDNGIYFYQVVSESNVIKTEKFVVSK